MFVKGLRDVGAGAAAGVAVVTALPLAAVGLGAAGAITASGLAVGIALGGAAAVADTALKNKATMGRLISLWRARRQ